MIVANGNVNGNGKRWHESSVVVWRLISLVVGLIVVIGSMAGAKVMDNGSRVNDIEVRVSAIKAQYDDIKERLIRIENDLTGR